MMENFNIQSRQKSILDLHIAISQLQLTANQTCFIYTPPTSSLTILKQILDSYNCTCSFPGLP